MATAAISGDSGREHEHAAAAGAAAGASGTSESLLEPRVVPRRRVRVLFLNDTARNGGPGRSLFYILKFLDPAVIQRTVMLPRPGVIGELYEREGVFDHLLYESDLVENPVEPWSRAMTRDDFDAPLALRGVRLLGNVAKSVRGLAKLTSVIQRGGFDLLYCNGTNACFAGGALSYTTKVPALWHVRYTSVPPALRAVHNQLAASKGVARIVCVSKAAQSLFPHAVAMGKTRVIHNALDASEFESSKVEGILRKELGLADDVVLFGSQGRILPRKGYVEMVRAAELALREMTAAERTKVHFAVLGDTPEDIRPDHLAECRALVRELGLEKCFTFLGFRDDVKPYVADFDVAVVPSVYPDPLPRAVIESMAMGKPVVAFDVGGVAEMLEHGVTGSLVRGTPPDVAGMAETFVRYLRHPAARAEEGRAARIRIEKDFDSRAQSRKIQNEIVRTSGLATHGTAEA